MPQEQLKKFNQRISHHSLPRWKDLPELELYMDQVIVLMQKYLGPYMLSEDLVTPSMINNYVKMNVLPAPIKKKYSKLHIARLLVICLMKRQLPIPIISRMIEEQACASGMDVFFNSFVEAYESEFKKATESIFIQEEPLVCALKFAVSAAVNHTMAESAVNIITLQNEDPNNKDPKKKQ